LKALVDGLFRIDQRSIKVEDEGFCQTETH
jgi:hypothetical protein